MSRKIILPTDNIYETTSGQGGTKKSKNKDKSNSKKDKYRKHVGLFKRVKLN